MTIQFLDKSVKPDDEMLRSALGSSHPYWEEFLNKLNDQNGKIQTEWKYYGAKSGWTLKILLKKRNLFFVVPCDSYFKIAFVFGDKAVKVVEESDLPAALINEVTNARRYVEGRVLQIEVKRREQIDDIMKLTAIKVNN